MITDHTEANKARLLYDRLMAMYRAVAAQRNNSPAVVTELANTRYVLETINVPTQVPAFLLKKQPSSYEPPRGSEEPVI